MYRVWLFAAGLGLALVGMRWVYGWDPASELGLATEDGPVEVLTALIYLGAAILAFKALRNNSAQRWLLTAIAATGIIGCLDEISFGERLFGLTMPVLYGEKIDGVHDLLDVGLRWLRDLPAEFRWGLGLVTGGGAAAVAVALFWQSKTLTGLLRLWRLPAYRWLLVSVVLLLTAAVYDSQLIYTRALSGVAAGSSLVFGMTPEHLWIVEEVAECFAALALVFSGLSIGLPEKPRPELVPAVNA